MLKMSKFPVLVFAWVVALVAVGGAQGGKITPVPQPGSDGSIQTFVSDHGALTNMRKNSSALFSAEKIDRRTREYAKEYLVDVVSLEFLKPLPLKKGETFQEIPVRTVTQGDFHNLMTHFNRMHIFMMIQNPVRFEMVPDSGPTAKQGYAKITWENLYTAIANPADYYRYGKPGEVKTNLNIGDIEAREDEKVDAMRMQVNELGKVQENGLLSRLLEDTLDGLSQMGKPVALTKILWTPSKGMELYVNAPASSTDFKVFETFLAQKGFYKDFNVRSEKQKNADTLVVSFAHDPQKLVAKIPFPNRGSLQFPEAYSPLGRINPFILDPKAPERFVTPSENDLWKTMTVFDYHLTSSNPGFLGLGRKAEVTLPNQRKMSVDIGDVLTRYHGRVVAIENNQIVVEEIFSNAFGEMQKKRFPLKVSTSVDS